MKTEKYHPPVTQEDLDRLTKEERKIYDAILKAFPETAPASAYNAALMDGGISFQFKPS